MMVYREVIFPDVLVEGVYNQFDDPHAYELHVSCFSQNCTHGN